VRQVEVVLEKQGGGSEMRQQIELSVMKVNPPNAGGLREALAEFEAETRIHVNLRVITWDDAWAELVKVAIYGDGPDISEVGSTWMPDLVGMNGLRPLTPAEVQRLGDPADFFPASWQSASLGDPSTVWAVPWLVDTRILYYRRDLLEHAGINAQEAFRTPMSLAQTLSRLRAAGNAIPWVVPSQDTRMTLHNSASFVWGAGGDFVSADGQRILLDQPESRAGFKEYYGLARFLAGAARNLTEAQSDALFWKGRAAVTLSGPWVWGESAGLPDVSQTLPPGIPFVGGSHLVIWRHTRRPEEALELARFLTSSEFQRMYSVQAGLLPARPGVLSEPDSAATTFYRHMVPALVKGRSFPSIPLWGLIEKRVSEALTDIWRDILRSAAPDVDAILDDHLVSTARRLRTVLDNA
jgi:multiple sugar transport system substrate-binding protein